jgi:hypothetical protein
MEMIQQLPNNPYFVLALIAVFGLVWFRAPKTVFWKKHIVDNHNNHQNPACFMCNDSGSACFENYEKCAALREQLKYDGSDQRGL